MPWRILSAGVLVAITVAVHATGFGLILRSLIKPPGVPLTGLWSITWLLILVTWCLLLIHLVEILLWGLFYFWKDCLPDAGSAFYFAGVTYTAVGYRDLVLPKPWRMLAPLEGLTGIFMCGLSVGLLFAVVSKIYASRLEAKRE